MGHIYPSFISPWLYPISTLPSLRSCVSNIICPPPIIDLLQHLSTTDCICKSFFYLSIILSMYMSVHPAKISIYLSTVCPSILSVYLFLYLFIHLSISIYNRCIHLYVCLSVHPSIISFCLSVFLSLMSTVSHLCLSVSLSIIYLCLSSIQSIIHRQCPHSFCRYPRSSNENPPDETLSYLRKGCSPRDGAETWPLLPPSRK